MSTKKCPNCGLYSSESALRCDCGYDFASAQVKPMSLEGEPVTQGKKFEARAGAYLIDLLVLYVSNLGIGMASGFFVGSILMVIGREDFTFNEQTLRALDLIVGIILSILYFTLFEGIYGASVGKLILGMRVVQIEGRPSSLGTAFVRALFRLVDGLFFGYIAYRSMKPPLQQRLGDKAAKTIVVGHKDALIQEHRPGWLFVVVALLYLILAAVGTNASLILSIQ